MVSATPAMEVELGGGRHGKGQATGRNGSDGVVGVVVVLWQRRRCATWAWGRRRHLGRSASTRTRLATGRNGSDGVVGVVVVVGGGEEMGTADLKKIG
ncbi:hypothetical protein M0R45_008860 [Rubus argutus]|uniref:Uncharacterized protein n=1 Tax=Rubus argutus TaxID=59490 RepID=A0AAW1Y1Y0_RUBAR